ncbi:MAG: nucleotidyl transferase AbiEii/AbiGii toxin family protein [Planctomycetes bacterium]|nr:nucleotidyl transferase AbiEii/AbiGii toxin family protein [Planctomycetota bacterium]
MIPPRNLSVLSNRLARAGTRRLPEAVLERDYCLAWFLVALSRTPLRARLAFKGGTALKRCYFADYRFSEDLDFTLAADTTFDDIRRGLEPVFAEARRATGLAFRFARDDRQTHENSHTFFIGYEGPLPAPAGGREVKVDITVRECLVFPIEDRKVLRGYPEYSDLPEDAKIRSYSLREIAPEKIVALMDRARNEPRDLYDVWYLADGGHVDLTDLTAGIEQKWDFRGKKHAEVRGEFAAKEPRYRKLWSSRLSGQMVDLPEFDEVYRSVRRALRQAGIIGK